MRICCPPASYFVLRFCKDNSGPFSCVFKEEITALQTTVDCEPDQSCAMLECGGESFVQSLCCLTGMMDKLLCTLWMRDVMCLS